MNGYGHVLPVPQAALINSSIQQAHGNLAESSRLLRRSADLFIAGNFPCGPTTIGHDSVNALLVGDFDRGREAFEVAAANELPDSCWFGSETGYQLYGKARLGDPDTSSLYDRLRPLIALGESMPVGAILWLLGAIEALVLCGRDDEAARLYPEIRDFVATGISVQSFTYGVHERVAGMAAAAAREWDASQAHFHKALELAGTLPHRVDQARVRNWYARMLLDRDHAGDRQRALQLLRDARALSESMEMRGLIELIDTLVGSGAERGDKRSPGSGGETRGGAKG